jgi:hypothetical protein
MKEVPVRDARYLRAQAELCLQMARQMSDHSVSESLLAEADRYKDEAARIETSAKNSVIKSVPDER